MNSYRGNERLEGGSDWPEAIRLLVSGQTWTVGLLRAQVSLPAARYRKDLFDSLTHILENTENAGSGGTKHSVRGLTLAAVLCARLSWHLVATQDQRCSPMCSRPGCGKRGHVLLGKIEGIINKKDGAGLWAQGGGGVGSQLQEMGRAAVWPPSAWALGMIRVCGLCSHHQHIPGRPFLATFDLKQVVHV